MWALRIKGRPARRRNRSEPPPAGTYWAGSRLGLGLGLARVIVFGDPNPNSNPNPNPNPNPNSNP